jgi:hypothetical protein
LLDLRRTCLTLSCALLCIATLSLLPSTASADMAPNPWTQLLGRLGKDVPTSFATDTTLELTQGTAWTALPKIPTGLPCAPPPDGPQHKHSIWRVFNGPTPFALELSNTEAAFWAVDNTQMCLVRWTVATREQVCATPTQTKADPLLSLEVTFDSENPEALSVNGEAVSLKRLSSAHPADALSPSNPLATMHTVKVGEASQGFRVHVGFQGQPTSGATPPTPPPEPTTTPATLDLAWHREAAGVGDVFAKQTCPVDGIAFGCSLAWEVTQTPDGQPIGHLTRSSVSGGADREAIFSTGDKEDSFLRWDSTADTGKGRWRLLRSELTQGSSINPATCNDYDNVSRTLTRCERTVSEATWLISTATTQTIQGCEVQTCPEGKECPADQCAFITTEQMEGVTTWNVLLNGQSVLLGDVNLPKTQKELSKNPCPVDQIEDIEDGMIEGEGVDE